MEYIGASCCTHAAASRYFIEIPSSERCFTSPVPIYLTVMLLFYPHYGIESSFFFHLRNTVMTILHHSGLYTELFQVGSTLVTPRQFSSGNTCSWRLSEQHLFPVQHWTWIPAMSINSLSCIHALTCTSSPLTTGMSVRDCPCLTSPSSLTSIVSQLVPKYPTT